MCALFGPVASVCPRFFSLLHLYILLLHFLLSPSQLPFSFELHIIHIPCLGSFLWLGGCRMRLPVFRERCIAREKMYFECLLGVKG